MLASLNTLNIIILHIVLINVAYLSAFLLPNVSSTGGKLHIMGNISWGLSIVKKLSLLILLIYFSKPKIFVDN